jgi:hypothetical protein
MDRFQAEKERTEAKHCREDTEPDEQQPITGRGGHVVGYGGIGRIVGNLDDLSRGDLPAVGRTYERT